MYRDPTFKTGSIAGTSELTVLAPIKAGLVTSLDTLTYKSRVKRVLRALHTGRSNALEFTLVRAMSDAVERVGRIHSVRIAVLEPEDKVLLAVTFDGAWESYVRVIWQKVSRLLDLIFCNTQDYVTGYDHSFEAWGRWLRASQAEVPFLYATPGLTVADQQYLRMSERAQRLAGSSDRTLTALTVPDAETIAWKMAEEGTDPTNVPANPADLLLGGREALRQGMQGLAGLYGLSDAYSFGHADGLLLHRAARELLPEFIEMSHRAVYQTDFAELRDRFAIPLDWLARDLEPVPAVRQPPGPPTGAPVIEHADVQGGIVQAYDGATHGCVILLAFDDRVALAEFLAVFDATRADTVKLDPGQIVRNLSFTLEGLRQAGMSDAEIDWLPEEFRQGMARRAALLGDLHGNHPRRWRLPGANWTQGIAAPDLTDTDAATRVELGAVHAALQLRLAAPASGAAPRERLFLDADSLLKRAGARTHALSIQWLERQREAGATVEHFGFYDPQSDPQLDPASAGDRYPNIEQLGEALLGHDNAVDRASPPLLPRDQFLRNGSFLVMRKLRQDIAALEAAADVAAAASPPAAPLDRELVLAKMVGRWRVGTPDAGQPLIPLAGGNGPNDFDYLGDPAGSLCPLHAHMRRANPRAFASANGPPALPGARTPRLFRRGMSYGPRHDPKEADPVKKAASLAAERGLLFMAYNSSLGEQFEVVQRWLAGGNSTDTYSGQSDPLLGVAEAGRPRVFCFEHGGQVVRVKVGGANEQRAEPVPIVRLEWGAYLFTPSVSTLGRIQAIAERALTPAALPWRIDDGEREIARLQALTAAQGDAAAVLAWKAALEDPEAAASYTSASIWAAIRAHHGGALRTPYGVLVASRSLVDTVLLDEHRRYSVSGYLDRARQSIGAIYLGLDHRAAGDEYERQSEACNAAIEAITERDAYDAARQATQDALQQFIEWARDHATDEARWRLTLDVRELIDAVLATLCEKWFGLSEVGGFWQRGGMRWDWADGDAPRYPGHFTAPSRYMFQPHPQALVGALAARHGYAVRSTMERFIAAQAPAVRGTLIGAAVLGPVGTPTPVDLAARTLSGALMGFLPTTDGNLRRVLLEWLRDGTFWALRARTPVGSLGDAGTARTRLGSALCRTMQLRPVPELVWRTAVAADTLAEPGQPSVAVAWGDRVVLALVSATQQGLEREPPSGDVMPVFGGARSAAAPSPTHACPGYAAAMGAMLGVLGALLDQPGALRAGAAPLVFALEGDMPPVPAAPRARASVELCSVPHVLMRSILPDALTGLDLAGSVPFSLTSAARRGNLLAWGDSWFKAGWLLPLARPITRHLSNLGYNVDTSYCAGGRTLAEMAAVDPKGAGAHFYRHLRSTMGGLKAILLCGGGNDVHVNRRLCRLLHPQSPGSDPFIASAVDDFVDKELRAHYDTILANIHRITGGKVPVLIHGYDHPVPDGRPSWPLKSWLYPCITVEKNYPSEPDGRAIMVTLIDRLNAMIGEAVKPYAAVQLVNLCGTLAKQPGYATDYTDWWVNELHPSDDGFAVLAAAIDAALEKLPVVSLP